MKKVFLDNIPRNGKLILWKYSINKIIRFIYDEIEGEMQIIDYDPINQFLTVKYDNIKFKIKTGNLMNGQIGKILGQHTSDYKIEIGTRFKDDKRDITIIDRKIEKRRRQQLCRKQHRSAQLSGHQYRRKTSRTLRRTKWNLL